MANIAIDNHKCLDISFGVVFEDAQSFVCNYVSCNGYCGVGFPTMRSLCGHTCL